MSPASTSYMAAPATIPPPPPNSNMADSYSDPRPPLSLLPPQYINSHEAVPNHKPPLLSLSQLYPSPSRSAPRPLTPPPPSYPYAILAEIEALYSSKPLAVNPDRTVTLTRLQMITVDPSEKQLVSKSSSNNITLLSLAGAASSGLSGDTQFERDLSKALLTKLQCFATGQNTALDAKVQHSSENARHYHENKLITMLHNKVVYCVGKKKTKGTLTSVSCVGEHVMIQIQGKGAYMSTTIPMYVLLEGSVQIEKSSIWRSMRMSSIFSWI